MGDFDLDLGTIEQEMDDGERRVVLGVLDGDTAGEAWVEEIATGNVLVLHVDGTLTDLAAEFASAVKDGGGSLVHFRNFLIVSPPDVEVDTDRL